MLWIGWEESGVEVVVPEPEYGLQVQHDEPEVQPDSGDRGEWEAEVRGDPESRTVQ